MAVTFGRTGGAHVSGLCMVRCAAAAFSAGGAGNRGMSEKTYQAEIEGVKGHEKRKEVSVLWNWDHDDHLLADGFFMDFFQDFFYKVRTQIHLFTHIGTLFQNFAVAR